MSVSNNKFWLKPLNELNHKEWEALCDGCAKCCLIKFQDEDTEEILFTKVACKLLDLKTCRCKSYDNRTKKVDTCLKITPENISEVKDWLPDTCAYRLRADDQLLPNWHYLISGKEKKVHQKNKSVKHFALSSNVISEEEVEESLEHFVYYF